LTQAEAAIAAGVSPQVFRRVERTGAVRTTLPTLRAVFAPFDARIHVSVWWRGATLDRILDESHAALVERVIALLTRRGWQTASEVTFSEYGERGSIDVFGFEPRSRACVVGEVKSDWGSLEETNRRLDVKTRLAPKLCLDRFGVRPSSVSRLLILPNNVTLRRVAARHAATLEAVYPSRADDIRRWLWRPGGAINGLWFVSIRPTSSVGSGRDEG
jgi:hypothetical protein